jgi:hypothetical protein
MSAIYISSIHSSHCIGAFNSVVRSPVYAASVSRPTLYRLHRISLQSELERVKQQTAVTKFEVLSRHLPSKTTEKPNLTVTP